MSLEKRLAEEMIRRHPERAAVALELTGSEDSSRLLSRATAKDAAPVLQRMTPQFAARILGSFEVKRMAAVIEELPLDVAARLVRRIPSEQVLQVLAAMGARRSRAVESLLRFPEGSAGALMDPEVLALPEILTAREALNRVREAPENARYNIYVVDSEQHLVGVVNLRELMLGRPAARLADLMVRQPQRLDARADRLAVVSHRGWREVHSLPVVDEEGGYLGAVRYRTLRALENELFSRNATDSDARESLGQLFTAGAGAVLEALSAPTNTAREQ